MMKKEYKIYILLAIIITTIISAIYYAKLIKNSKEETLYIKQYISNTQKLLKLKNWKDNNNFNKTIKKILALKKPKIYQNKKRVIELQFSNLGKDSFLRIGDAILNNYLIIKSLKIDKNSKNKIELTVELQK